MWEITAKFLSYLEVNMKILKGTIITPFEKFFGYITVEKEIIMDVVKG
jgi:hypothetical protein